MGVALTRRPALFVLLILGYFALNVVVRLVLPHELELDEAQQSLLTQWIALGYDTQPPFYNWVQYGVSTLFGNSLASLSILKNLLLAGTYLLYFAMARTVLADRAMAMVATLGLLTIPHIVWESQRDLTHSVALNFAAVLFLLGFFRTLRAPALWTYALTGLAIGIGMMAKYNFALLVIAAAVAALADPISRRRVLDIRLAVTALVALLVVLPHALWLKDHLALGSGATLAKLQTDHAGGMAGQILSGLLSIVEAFAGYAAAATVVFVLMFGKRLWARPPQTAGNVRLIERMILVLLVLLILMVLLAGAASFKERWLSPVLIVLPLYFTVRIQASGVSGSRALSLILPVALFVMCVVPAALYLRVASAGWTGDYQKISVPYGAFARAMTGTGETPGLVIAQDRNLSGNLRLHMPDSVVDARWYPTFPGDDQVAPGKPVLLVWRIDSDEDTEMPEELATYATQKLGPAARQAEERQIAIPYHFSRNGDAYRFGYAWVNRPTKPAGP